MRILVLNLGNTTLFGGVYEGDRLIARFRVPIEKASTPKGFAAKVVRRAGGRISRAVLASVVPDLTAPIVKQVVKAFGVPLRILEPKADHGLRIGYRRPSELGSDRLAAALGARVLWPQTSVIVVDCGTATTVTALRGDGLIAGGAILPGVELWSDVLAARTARLPRVAPSAPHSALGRSPREAIAAGIYFGHGGAIREVVRRIVQEAFHGAPVTVVGTGGHAALFARLKLFTTVEPDLVLRGLRAFAESAD